MENKNTISVIIPLFNYQKYIKYCLKSCCCQKHEDIEIVVVNDKSTDDSANVVKNFIEKSGEKRIVFVELSRNSGYSVAKNEGIIASSGKYIVHLDADDMLTVNSIICRKKILDENPDIKMVHGRAKQFLGEKSYEWCLKNHNNLKIDKKTTIHAQGVMLRRNVYEEYGLYEEKLRSKADKEMWVRIRDIANLKIKQIEDVVAYYRFHEDSMMKFREKNKKYNNEIIKIYNNQIELRKKEGITKKNTRFIE